MERKPSYTETDEHAEENMISEGGPVYYTPEPLASKLESPATPPALETLASKGSERFFWEKTALVISKALPRIGQGLIGMVVGISVGSLTLEYAGVPMSFIQNPLILGTLGTLGALAAWGTAEISKRILTHDKSSIDKSL